MRNSRDMDQVRNARFTARQCRWRSRMRHFGFRGVWRNLKHAINLFYRHQRIWVTHYSFTLSWSHYSIPPHILRISFCAHGAFFSLLVFFVSSLLFYLNFDSPFDLFFQDDCDYSLNGGLPFPLSNNLPAPPPPSLNRKIPRQFRQISAHTKRAK